MDMTWPAETEAMRLVSEHTSVPVSEVISTEFGSENNKGELRCPLFRVLYWKRSGI